MQLKIGLTNSGLIKKFIAKYPAVIEGVMDENAAWGTAKVRKLTPHGKSSNKAFQSWSWRKIGKLKRLISNPMQYVKFLETGTGLFGPLHKRITSKSGGPLHWISLVKKFTRGAKAGQTSYRQRITTKKGGYKESDIFAMSTKGMPAQPMIAPNKELILTDLRKRAQKRIRDLWTTSREMGVKK
jgi:hypothetical protein